jgi:hypothetical protein
MSETSHTETHEGHMRHQRSITPLEAERELREEAEMAAVGDVEAQREYSEMDEVDEKEGVELPDPFLVTWDGDDDPLNPLNFSVRRKVGFMGMIAAICFLTYFSL